MTQVNIIDIVRFLFILMICLMVFSLRKKSLSRSDWTYLQAAIFFTVCADFCMLILYEPLPGILIFCLAQMVYAIRHDRKNGKTTVMCLAVAAVAVVFISYILNLSALNAYLPYDPAPNMSLPYVSSASALYTAAVIYSICEGTSLYKSVNQYIKRRYPCPNRQMILAGMLLFVLCDVNVALYNVIPESYAFMFAGKEITYASLCGGLIWVFYIPSQILLALSGKDFNINSEKPLSV